MRILLVESGREAPARFGGQGDPPRGLGDLASSPRGPLRLDRIPATVPRPADFAGSGRQLFRLTFP